MARNLMVFSRTGIHHVDRERGDAVALFVSSREQARRFSDIGTINTKNVKERYGDIGQTPLWRQEGSAVQVYGLLPESMEERRSGLEVYLPEDFAPDGTSVFYFVISNRLIVHGVRTVNDDGGASWGVSRLDTSAEGALDVLVSAVSERIAGGVRENICIAVHDDKLFNAVAESMEPFGQNVIRMGDLSPSKTVQPLYVHRDHGLFYIIFAMEALILFLAAGFSAVTSFLSLNGLKDEIVSIEKQIQATKSSQRLGRVQNPNAILDFMSRPLKQRPSSILHASGEVATALGQVTQIEMDASNAQSQIVKVIDANGKTTWGNEQFLPVKVIVEGAEKYLLIDQERVAKSALEERPWIRHIERQATGAGQNMALEIGVRID